MDEITVDTTLLGEKIVNDARPEWGVGTVLRVQKVSISGKSAHRVSVQFSVGHRTLLVPPARLRSPGSEPERESGWLASAGKLTLDDRLRALPEEVSNVLGTPAARFAAVIPLYAFDQEPASLQLWCRRQTGVADPLTHWTRDELLEAFRNFCNERDAYLRVVAAKIKHSAGPDKLREALESVPPSSRDAVFEALRRVL